jgi:hypothetical protein
VDDLFVVKQRSVQFRDLTARPTERHDMEGVSGAT